MKYFRSSLIITIMDKIRTLQHFHYHYAKIKSQEMQYWVPYLIYGYNSEHIWMQSLFYSWKNNWLVNSHPIHCDSHEGLFILSAPGLAKEVGKWFS